MNVLVKTTMILTDIVDMDTDDRTVIRLALRSYLQNSNPWAVHADYLARAKHILEQLEKVNNG